MRKTIAWVVLAALALVIAVVAGMAYGGSESPDGSQATIAALETQQAGLLLDATVDAAVIAGIGADEYGACDNSGTFPHNLTNLRPCGSTPEEYQNMVNELMGSPSPTLEPVFTATPAEIVCKPDYFTRLAYGFVDGFGSQSDRLDVVLDCNYLGVTFANGAYLYGAVAPDGLSLASCAYLPNGSDEWLTCNLRLSRSVEAPNLNAEGGVSIGAICLAEKVDGYTGSCQNK